MNILCLSWKSVYSLSERMFLIAFIFVGMFVIGTFLKMLSPLLSFFFFVLVSIKTVEKGQKMLVIAGIAIYLLSWLLYGTMEKMTTCYISLVGILIWYIGVYKAYFTAPKKS